MSQMQISLRIAQPADIVMARKYVREVAGLAGLQQAETEAMATAVSEVAQNIIAHAGRGEITVEMINKPGQCGVGAVAADEGPGIPDPDLALEDGYSTADSLGLGLSSAKRLVDEFEIETADGKGTTITLRKWNHDRSRPI